MKSYSDRLQQISLKIVPILKKYKISRAGLFGSILREDFNAESDVDLLVELNDQNVTQYFDLKFDLEKKLQRTVDVLQYDRLHSRIKKQVMSDQVSLSL